MLRIIAALIAGLLLCAQTPMLPGFPPGTFQNRAALDAPSAVIPLSLDGSIEGNSGGTTALPVVLSTTNANDIICVFVETNAASVTSVVGSTLGSFTRRATTGNSPQSPLELWYKVAASPLASETITVNLPTSAFTTVVAFGVTGGKTSAPFDVNGSLPATLNQSGASPITISTTASDTMLIAGFRQGATFNPTAGPGFTAIQLNNDYMIVQYKIVSAAQTSLAIASGTGAADTNGSIADALVQGP